MIDAGAVEAALRELAAVKVLCIGDVMLDRFVYGAIERISPEAPVPVIRIERETQMLGGAGNVARNAAALGASVHLVAVCGDDEAGLEVGSQLAGQACLDASIVVDAARQTSVKTRYVAANQQVLRADRETTAPLGAAASEQLIAAAIDAMPVSSVVVLSDYAKGVLTGANSERLIEAAGRHGLPVIVDPKGRDYRRYRGVRLLTPNRRELAEATGLPVGTIGEVTDAGRRLLAIADAAAIIATLGRDGMLVLNGGEPPVHIEASGRDVFDVTGAGDTVVATLACLLAAGGTLTEAAVAANAAAGIVVGKVGTAVVTAEELAQAMRLSHLTVAEAKVRSLPAALEQIAVWRQQGVVVGFTNGCFDLIHPGHISLLAQARANCDRLIVGLNSDASVRRLKGEGRPVQSEAARALVLASLATVDMVVGFAEDTPLALIEALRPDVLIKGADYRIDEVVGADFVRGHGGRVVLAALEPGFSTSATLAKLAGGR